MLICYKHGNMMFQFFLFFTYYAHLLQVSDELDKHFISFACVDGKNSHITKNRNTKIIKLTSQLVINYMQASSMSLMERKQGQFHMVLPLQLPCWRYFKSFSNTWRDSWKMQCFVFFFEICNNYLHDAAIVIKKIIVKARSISTW